MSLVEFQTRMHAAIVRGDPAAVSGLIAGGCDPAARLAIHRRHYEASLARALADKFPALVWYVGSAPVVTAARAFAHAFPPQEPCIANYGLGFPAFLAAQAGVSDYPWLVSLGDLEWRVGRASIAIDATPVAPDALAAVPAGHLADCRLTLQPGLFHIAAGWPVDELIALFVSGNPPEQYRFEPLPVHLEVSGARGRYAICRLTTSAFAFRQALAAGATVAEAAERGLDTDGTFDPGRALVDLAAAGLVTAIINPVRGPLS